MLPWATITNGATEATTVFDLCPPAGNYQLTMESIDLNSPLMPTPSMLKTDVINLSVAALTTKMQAFNCGQQLPAVSQTNAISASYDIYSGNQDVPLPVMSNHLPGLGYTQSQELLSGVLTLTDGTTQNIVAGDTATLAAIGVAMRYDAS